MNPKTTQSPLLLRIALVLALVFAQGSMSVHAVSHSAGDGAPSCATCNLGSNLQAGAMAAPMQFAFENTESSAYTFRCPETQKRVVRRKPVRAPPEFWL